jgi:predicted nucleic acid-binding protein
MKPEDRSTKLIIHRGCEGAIFFQFRQDQKRLITTSFVFAEIATVLSNCDGQNLARHFLSAVRSGAIPIIFICEALQESAEQVFITQEKKHTSMVDCANVVVMHQFYIPTIWSFDSFYFKKFHSSRQHNSFSYFDDTFLHKKSGIRVESLSL